MAGLMGYLLRLDPAQRARLAEMWGLPPAEGSPASLYREMTDPWPASFILARLSPAARAVLDLLLAARPRRRTTAEIAQSLPLTDEELVAAVEELAAAGLAVPAPRSGAAEYAVADEIARAVSDLARRAAETAPAGLTVEEALRGLSSPELQRLAERWGIANAEAALRRELLKELADRLGGRETARLMASRLSPAARRALTALVRAGGRLEVTALARATGLDERHLRAAARELAETFLIRPSFAGGRRALVAPLGLGAVDADHGEAPPAPLREMPGPPLGEPTFALLRDLLVLLAYVRDAQPPLARLPLSEMHRRRLAPLLSGRSEENRGRLAFLQALAVGLDLLGESENGLCPTARAAEWEQLHFPVQAVAAFRWWLESERWREGLAQSDHDLGGPLALAQGRSRLCRLLMACEPGRWYALADFLAWLREREPLLFREREALLASVGQAGLERVARHWERWDGALARGVLLQSLRWLEAVEVRPGPQEMILFAVTPLGGWLLGRRGAAAPLLPCSPSLVRVAAGGLAVAWPDAPTLAGLLRFARPQAGAEPATYALDAASVRAAVERGRSLAELWRLLEQHGALDADLKLAIEGWAAAIKPLRTFRGLLVEAETEAALDALQAAGERNGFRLRRLAPTVALVLDEEAFIGQRERLLREGFVVRPGVGSG